MEHYNDKQAYYRNLVETCDPKLEQDIHDDEAHKRYKVLRSEESGELYSPDASKIVNILKAFGMSDPQVWFDQGYCYIVAGLLYYLDDEVEVFFCLKSLMDNHNWRQHYKLDDNKRREIKIKQYSEEMKDKIPNLHKLIVSDPIFGELTIQNLYDNTLYNCCFHPKMPITMSALIFEWVIFDACEDNSLIILIVYMLLVCQEKITSFENSLERA